MRYLGIDWGEKNIGIAVSDEEESISVPFTLLKGEDWDDLVNDIGNIIRRERISEIVIGIPLTLEGNESVKARQVRVFASNLEKYFNLPMHFEDERLTSRMANQDHSQAASYILQSFLDARHGSS